MTLEEVRSATGAHCTTDLRGCHISRISTDSREDVDVHTLFVPLVGERYDAHDFLGEVAARGVNCFLVDKRHEVSTGKHTGILRLVVEDTKQALGDIAAYYRSKFKIPFIAVTGSCGKTTTKDLIAAFLSARHTVHKNQGNFNNDIGVPKTLFQLSREHTIAVIETGMNHAGELTRLSEIVEPSCAVVTNVEPVHLEHFASIEDIARAKAEIFTHLAGGKLAVLNADNKYATILRGAASRFGAMRIVMFSVRDAQVSGPGTFSWHGVVFRHNLPGVFNLLNILAALTVAEQYGISPEQCRDILATFTSGENRMRTEHIGDALVINDTYNSNPTALKLMLDHLNTFTDRTRIAVIGDMKELGKDAAQMHRDIGKHIDTLAIESIYTCGDLAGEVLEGIQRPVDKRHFKNREELADTLKAKLAEHAVMLVKASHSARFDEIVVRLKQ